MAVRKTVSTVAGIQPTVTGKAKTVKQPRVKGKAFTFYAKGVAAAAVEKIKGKGDFSLTILQALKVVA